MIYTSYFAFIPKLPEDMLKISVSLYTPRWAQIDGCFPPLNPTDQMLREAKSSGTVSPTEAMKKYCDEILEKLSPTDVYEELTEMLNKSKMQNKSETQNKRDKKHIALLCYEKPGEICHRRFIARWLENGNDISVPEYAPENSQIGLFSKNFG